MAPNGVDTLKKARCFLHSGRVRDVVNKDVVKAKAVGAIIQSETDKWDGGRANLCVS
jgi:hypothetical protein